MSHNFNNQNRKKHGEIIGDKKINEYICYFFEYVCKGNQQRLKRKFRNLKSESSQIMHTLRELILGAHLSASGFRVRYDFVINNQTPDWCILDDDLSVVGIIELLSIHIDRATENEIRQHSELRDNYFYWRDGQKKNIDRLYQKIEKKAQKYSSQAISLEVPYVVAVFGEWELALDFNEIQSCLFNETTGLFSMYPEISGVLYFVDQNPLRYLFYYSENPSSLRPITMPTGVFPPESV